MVQVDCLWMMMKQRRYYLKNDEKNYEKKRRW